MNLHIFLQSLSQSLIFTIHSNLFSGLKSESENSAQLKKQGIRQINSAKDPILRDKSSSEEPSRNSEPNFPFGKDRSHAVLSKFYPVMTCFPEPGLYVNNPGS